MKLYTLTFLLLILCSCSSMKEQERLCLIFNDQCLNMDSLETNINVAYKVWRHRGWSKDYDEDIFLNYVLPPQIANEPLEYYWRTDIPEWLGFTYQGESMPEFAEKINSVMDIEMGRQNWGNDQMGYTAVMSGIPGKCDDRAILTTMAMRSMGIPAAFETIPLWGGTNNGHSFCGVIMPDSTTYAFQEKDDKYVDIRFANKVPKIYRQRYFDGVQSKAYALRNLESLPKLFEDFRLEDVTRYHGVECKDIDLPIEVKSDNRLCYLSLFHPSGWFPIACGEITGGNMHFKDIGTGVDSHMTNPLKGENIGNGILYLPIIFEDKIIPASYPLIVFQSGMRLLKPSSDKETIVLYRKYPLFERISMFADRMKGGIIEVAEKPDFSDAKIVHYIYDRPLSRMQTVKLEDKFRFIRFRRPEGALSIAELLVCDPDGKIIGGSPISCDFLDKEHETTKVFDKDPLTFLDVPHGVNLWVGLDLGRTVQVGSVGFCPRNDDNGVSPGDTYELLYWDNEWKSLGVSRAMEQKLVYNNVPKNALLWLRDKTRGKEERPFTYENGTQIWW